MTAAVSCSANRQRSFPTGLAPLYLAEWKTNGRVYGKTADIEVGQWLSPRGLDHHAVLTFDVKPLVLSCAGVREDESSPG
jgi:hypothetical protein